MKKFAFLISCLFLNFGIIFGQCPDYDLEFFTQEDIDNFSAVFPNCSVLTHELKINGEYNSITNLNGLSGIIQAQEIFIIQTEINSLFGLHNVQTIENFALWGHNNLQNLVGLSSLVEVGHFEIWFNSGITSLSGIDNLQSIRNVNIFLNQNLEDISQLSFLTSLAGGLTINGNNLNNFNGLQNLQFIEQDVSIAAEGVLDFSELNNLQSIGGSLFLQDIPDIQNFSGFINIESLVDLYIINCPNLDDFLGFENLTTVSGRLRIGFNPGITDLRFLKNIESVGYLDIYENENLETLQGIESIKSINTRIFIDRNPNLTSIEALNYLDIPTTFIELTNHPDEVVIINNTSLSICNNDFICSIINDVNVSKGFFNNTEGCNTIEEVLESCSLNFDNNTIEDSIGIFPNPVSDVLTITMDVNINIIKTQIFSTLGLLVLESSNDKIDLSILNSGIYNAIIITNKGTVSRKVLKE
jgi:hypothetical protein